MIACVYCGGQHTRPSDVRECWERDQVSSAPGFDFGFDVSAAAAESATTKPASPFHAIGLGRGPAVLGRHVIVGVGEADPADWAGCRRVVVGHAALSDPMALVAELRTATASGVGLIIDLAVDLDAHMALPETESRPQHELGPGFTFWLAELHHAVWSNAIDLRHPESPHWALFDSAVRCGAIPVADGAGDVQLPDGRRAWLDGGPVRFCESIGGVAVVHAVQIEHGRLDPPRTNRTEAALAPDQLAAVTHPSGSARIIAPAGSGKTRVLTERARHLVTVWGLAPSAISLVAFNKRAQEEMQERTRDLPGISVRTLNSTALAIINGSAPFAPQPRKWRTIDEPDVRRILGRFVQSPKKLNVDPLSPWLDALSLVRLGLVAPDQVEATYGGDVDGLGAVFPHYLAALESAANVDFDDQIRRAIDVLLTQPAARRAARRACRVMLVDEFQDLTPAHLLLIRLLAGEGGTVFGVGDDDQTIYGYNGADPAWLIDFASWFPGAGDHPLEVNYRCPPGVVEIADRLLRHNRQRVAKTIRSGRSGVAGSGWAVDTNNDPVRATVAAVQAALTSGVGLTEIAVLARVNATLAPVQLALAADKVGFSGGVGAEFVDRTAVRAGLAWLRLALGGQLAADDLGEALRRPSRSLHPRLRDWVTEQRSVDGLLRLADRITTERDSQRVAEFAGDVARLQALITGGADTARLLSVVTDEVGLAGAVATLDGNRHGMNRASQNDDVLALRQIADLQPDPRRFERWLRDGLMTRRDPDGVTLATVHRVKGQEWPHVVVHLAAADQFPHRLADSVEEERRLFHVAITRASTHVTIVTGNRVSPFIAELITEPPERPAPTEVDRRRTALAAPSRRQREGDPAHPLIDRDRVMAVIGLVLIDQGQAWTITELEPAAAVASRDGAFRKFALGEKVETAGRQRGPLGPRAGEVEDASVRLYDMLRIYRDGVRDGKPAYTVFDDKTLAAIATALPDTLEQLAGVKGVGPAKLEQHGDQVLAMTRIATGAEIE